MKTVYRVLAYLIALEVVVHAATSAFAVFGLGKWIDGGGVLDKATVESHSANFTGVMGLVIHAINGQYVVPFLAVLLLMVSFFARVPMGVRWAALVFVLVIVQVFLGTFGHGIPQLGLLHGLNALLLFAVADIAARRTRAALAQPRTAAPVGTAGVV